MTDAILVSELGVGLPIFTLCPIIAMVFGESSEKDISRTKIMVEYFRSPIFIAVVLGLLVAQFNLDIKNPFIIRCQVCHLARSVSRSHSRRAACPRAAGRGVTMRRGSAHEADSVRDVLETSQPARLRWVLV